MTLAETESEVLEATARKLTAQGYDVILSPSPSLLPAALDGFRPDAIALGMAPKLLIEVTREGTQNAKRVAELQSRLKGSGDWKLHLVLISGTRSSDPAVMTDGTIAAALERAKLVAEVDARSALLGCWAAFEALSRARMTDVFARPQSPGRIVERLASKGIVSPSEADDLRNWSRKRNDFVHGGLDVVVSVDDVSAFANLVQRLLVPGAFELGDAL
jgi:hypothetical protein